MEKLQVGQMVSCSLSGGKTGVIFDIHGDQSPESCRSILGGVGVSGGSAEFDIVWDNGSLSHGIPESLLRSSVPWEILDRQIQPPEVIEAMLTCVEETESAAIAVEKARKESFDKETERLIREYPYLKVHDKKGYSTGKFVAVNVRIELKKAFPGTKFSVTSDYNSVRVSWEDGPSGRDVDGIVNKYQHGSFDGMADIYESNASPWNEVFGGVDYAFTSHDFSDEAKNRLLDTIRMSFKENFDLLPQRPLLEMMRERIVVPGLEMAIDDLYHRVARYWDDDAGTVVDIDNPHDFVFLAVAEAKHKNSRMKA